ncbi:MAG: hypothetical protein JST89_21505 [Cyanobacteria bacterium SZAS-4]|nr:hypothetical protein [Cyanobacteria bacterium SZAS-4]
MFKQSLILLLVPLILAAPQTQASNNSDFVEKALSLEKHGDRAGALLEYGKALRQDPNDSVALIDRAILKFNSGEKQAAFADIDRALKVNMIDFNALRTRADFKAGSNNYKGALADYNEAIKWNKRDTSAYTNRGIMRVNMGETKEALADFEKAISIDNNLIARFNRLRLLPDQTAARAEYERLSKIEAKSQSQHLTLSNAHNHFGFKEKAVQELDAALSENPSYIAALYNRAVLRNELGNKDGSLADYNKYIELNGSNPKAYFNRGLLRESMNDREGSMNDIKRALELDPQLKLREGTPKPFELMLG